MPYHKIKDKLSDIQGFDAVGFPDGSVDRYFNLLTGKEEEIRTRAEFARLVRENPSCSFRLELKRKEPGGQTVNMSIQSHSLGAETSHYGMLDHSIRQELDFSVVAIGEPTEVDIFEMREGSINLAEPSEDLKSWSLDDLETEHLEELLSADIVNTGNWVSIRSMTESLRKLSTYEDDWRVFNFDAGDLTETDKEDILKLFQVLARLKESTDAEVIVHANTEEFDRVAEVYGLEGKPVEKVQELRDKTGVTAYIVHDKQRAFAGTPEGTIEVENLETLEVGTRTGAGDRFDAAAGCARAAGWDWDETLALGNTCAVNYVESNETASLKDVREQIETKI